MYVCVRFASRFFPFLVVYLVRCGKKENASLSRKSVENYFILSHAPTRMQLASSVQEQEMCEYRNREALYFYCVQQLLLLAREWKI